MFKLHIELEDLDAKLNRTGPLKVEMDEFCSTYADVHRALDRALGVMGIEELTYETNRWLPEDDNR